MNVPLGRGGIIHAWTSKGFIPNCFMPLNHRKEVTSMKKLTLKTLPSGSQIHYYKSHSASTIVMDNVLYHSIIYDQAPTLATRKEIIHSVSYTHLI